MERTPGQLLVWMAAAVLATLAAVRLLDAGGGPGPTPAPAVRVDRGTGSREPAGVYVHVAGAVRSPGLYRLRPADRVAVALERAGGPRGKADLAKVNLAARVEDGQQIVVPRAGVAGSSPVGGGAAGSGQPAAGARLSLSSASAEELDGLDGIGPTLAKRIVEYRDAHGGFRSLAELKEVEGIGDKRFEALREAVGP